MKNPDQIDASLWQNDHDRDLTELGHPSRGCGCGCFGALLEITFLGIIFIILAYATVYALFHG